MKYVRIILMLFVGALLGACEGTNHYEAVDDLLSQGPANPNPDPEPDPLPEVADGVLHLYANQSVDESFEIPANGSASVNFTVMWGKEDVSEHPSMYLIRTNEKGEETEMEAGAHAFSTTTPGVYTFKAKYFNKGYKYSDNEITVTATEISGGENFDRLFVGFQFTSLGCTFCPGFSDELKQVIDREKGRFEVVCFHQHFKGNDPLTIPMGELYYNKLTDGQGLPKFSLNMHKEISATGSAVSTAIRNEADKVPSTCGVKVESSFDEGTRKATVKMTVTSNVESDYRWTIFLTENDVQCSQGQMGVGNPTLYKHQHLVRLVSADNVYGTKFENKLKPGEPVTKTYTSQALPEDWNAGNMRAVALALTSGDGGKTYYVNNAAACPLAGGGDAPDPEPDPKPEPGENQFVRHIAYFKMTGVWCSPCYTGGMNMQAAILHFMDGEYKPNIHRLEFHGEDVSHDPLCSEATALITQQFKDKFGWNSTYPFGVVDMHSDHNPSNINESAFFDCFNKSLNDYPAHCGVAVKSVLNGTKADVTVRLMSEKSEVYRVAAYVLENGIIHDQEAGMQPIKNFTHNHVVRKLLSQSVQGDKFSTGAESDGTVKAGNEASKSFSVTLDPKWVKENLLVCALAYDAQGVVNNVAVCELNGGDTDYDRK